MDDAHKEPIKLNLGCGLNTPPEWINIDASFTARLSKWGRLYKVLCRFLRIQPVPWPKNIRTCDVRRGLPFSDNSVQVIFTSHMLEHITYEDARFVIRECHRCLYKGGVMRVIVPDLYAISKRYVESMTNNPNSKHGHIFLKDLGVLDDYKGLRRILGHARHLYMYDECSLRQLFEEAGFKGIERMSYGQSRITDIWLVEEKGRHEMAICLEGIKE